MNQRRILPTALIVLVLANIGLWACGDTGSCGRVFQAWLRALLAPQAARAADAGTGDRQSAEQPPATDPFASAAPVAPLPDPIADAPEPEAADCPQADQPRAAGDAQADPPPDLLPVPPRRANPRIDPEEPEARGQVAREPRTLPPAPAPTSTVERQDRYAHGRYDTAAVTPAGHADAPQPFAAVPQPACSSCGTGHNHCDHCEAQAAAALKEIDAAESLPIACAKDQSGGVALAWITPSSVTLGQEASCQLVVRNTTDATAHAVLIEASLAGGELVATEPKAAGDAKHLSWRLGDVQAGATTTLHVSFVPREPRGLSPQAAVTFTRSVAAPAIEIVEPRLEIAIEGEQETVVGQSTPCHVRVSNSGTGPAIGVAVDVQLAAGLAAAPGAKSRYVIGTLAPGESRQLQVFVSGTDQGEFGIAAHAILGDAAAAKAMHTLRVVRPALSVAVEGPKLRFVDRKAAYAIKVRNPGPAAIDNVQVMEQIPAGFRFVEATSGGSFDRNARQVAWFVGRLEPNETANVAVQLVAVEEGEHHLNVAARADYGVLGEAETQTHVKGAASVVIDVTEDDDPVEVDGETVYHVRLTNAGSTPARGVQFAAEVPREMEVVRLHGPSQGAIKGQQIVFPSIPVLESGQSATYDVFVRCRQAGQVRFRAYYRSEDNPTPVLEEETTRIYAD